MVVLILICASAIMLFADSFLAIKRLDSIKKSTSKDVNSFSIPNEFVLDLIASSISNGASLQVALCSVGKTIGGVDGKYLSLVGGKLLLGETWEKAWSEDANEKYRFTSMKLCLENSWYKGSSPIQAINSYLSGLNDVKNSQIKEEMEKLSVKIIIPIGLCFLPSFILIGVVPIIISLLGNVNM
jgi:hypothetical protein